MTQISIVLTSVSSRRSGTARLPRLLVGTMMIGLMFGSVVVRADTLVFKDLTDNLTVETTSARISGCAPLPLVEGCDATISAPAGFVFGHSDLFDTGGFAVTPDNGFNIAEPNGQIVSDTIGTPTTFPVSSIVVEFVSDSDSAPPFICHMLPVQACPLIETGDVQDVASVTWTDHLGNTVTDTIQFQSDVSDVPEPSAVLLFVTVIVALSIIRFRKRFRENQGI